MKILEPRLETHIDLLISRYPALDSIKQATGEEPLEVFNKAMSMMGSFLLQGTVALQQIVSISLEN